MLSSLAPARRRLVLVVLAAALLSVVLVGVQVVRGLEPAVTPVAQDQPGPVLLVPGYGGSTTALEVLAATLRRQGRDVTVVVLAGDGTGDLRVQAGVLDGAARAAAERTGSESVDVVGYSAGGVVARLWVRDDGGDALARRVVTLGSPHHGTSVAAIAADVTPDSCPVGCQQLAPDSDLLRALNAGDETPPGPVFVSVWTTADRVVKPPASARLDGALDVRVQSVCPRSRVGHGELPIDPQVQAIVLAVLSVDTPAVPTACSTVRASS
jgi:triacylglycerol esterase/lipase EstA (alpha/beta hydrolase family)